MKLYLFVIYWHDSIIYLVLNYSHNYAIGGTLVNELCY